MSNNSKTRINEATYSNLVPVAPGSLFAAFSNSVEDGGDGVEHFDPVIALCLKSEETAYGLIQTLDCFTAGADEDFLPVGDVGNFVGFRTAEQVALSPRRDNPPSADAPHPHHVDPVALYTAALGVCDKISALIETIGRNVDNGGSVARAPLDALFELSEILDLANGVAGGLSWMVAAQSETANALGGASLEAT